MTFAYKVDAYEAVERGNDDPSLPKYDLSFGGRRAFCKETYADLGNISDVVDRKWSILAGSYNNNSTSVYEDAVDDDGRSKANDVDFETLLKSVQAQIHRRPCS